MTSKTTKNKGEWSEFYVLLKILAEQKIYSADKYLNAISNQFYPVLKIIAAKGTEDQVIYTLSETSKEINIYNLRQDKYSTILKSDIQRKLKEVFAQIVESSKTFELTTANELRQKLECTRIKSGSNSKTDIVLEIHDFKSGIDSEVGFSIKSTAGSAATLLNAGPTTNFVYKLSNNKIDYEEINAIDSKSKIRDRVNKILNSDCNLTFVGTFNDTFAKNMRIIDSLFDRIMSEVVVLFYKGNGNTVADLTKILENENPIQKSGFAYEKELYELKIKEFLVDVALGMMPSKLWNGRIEAIGGYIIVLRDGEIACYHAQNWNELRDYLFENTKLETASSTKHDFGKIYKVDGDLFINLNLQIRFINQKKMLTL